MDEKEILGFQTYVQVWPLIKHSQGPDFFISRLICCFSVKNKIQNESKTARWDFFKFLKPSSNLFKRWCKSSSLLKELCNQTKLLHHYFQTVLNMFKIWCNQNKLLHHLYQCFQKKFFPLKRWCNQNKLLYCYFQTVLNLYQTWRGRGQTCNEFTSLNCAGLGPGLHWIH